MDEELPEWEAPDDDLANAINEALKGTHLTEAGDITHEVRRIIRTQLYSFDADREVAELLRMEEEQPESSLYIQEGLVAFYQGRYERVLVLLTAIERPSALVTFLIADAEASLGDLDTALEDYKNVIAENPRNVDALLSIACAHYDLDNVEDQLDFLNRALALDESRTIGWRARGFLYLGIGKPDESCADFKRALFLDPEDWESHFGIARGYHLQGDVDNALKHYNIYLESNPHVAVALYYRACAHFDQDRMGDALADLDSALEVSRDDPSILVKLGEIHHVEGRYKDAALCYRRAFALADDGDKCEILQNLGYVLINDDHPSDAFSIAMEILEMGDTVDGLLLRADARLRMGDVKGAENDCNLARAGDKDSGAAIYLMQRIMTERGWLREAKKYEKQLEKLLAA